MITKTNITKPHFDSSKKWLLCQKAGFVYKQHISYDLGTFQNKIDITIGTNCALWLPTCSFILIRQTSNDASKSDWKSYNITILLRIHFLLYRWCYFTQLFQLFVNIFIAPKSMKFWINSIWITSWLASRKTATGVHEGDLKLTIRRNFSSQTTPLQKKRQRKSRQIHKPLNWKLKSAYSFPTEKPWG